MRKATVVVFLLGLMQSPCRGSEECRDMNKPECQNLCALMTKSKKCISIHDVDDAFTSAKESNGNQTKKDLDNLGVIMIETAKTLGQKFNLSKEEIANGLPLINSTQTLLKEHCPSYLTAPTCHIGRYRSLEGLCNNLVNPEWGSARNIHHRFLTPDYADGISTPRVSKKGKQLSSARLVSLKVHQEKDLVSQSATNLLVAWGQFIDHDIALTAETRDSCTGESPKCCSSGKESNHSNCFPIDIPIHDTFNLNLNRKCMNFVRSKAGLRFGCKLGAREQTNELSSFLDAGTVYSNSPEKLKSLRTYKGGLLKTEPAFENLKDLLPLNTENRDELCMRTRVNDFCFLAGDVRVNEQIALTMLHTIFVREHNRIATELGKINCHWNDEKLFQETRHIVAALIQQITYNEFLPVVLGEETSKKHDLVLQNQGFFQGYDSTINPTIANGFATAAYRFGHSLLPTKVERWSKTHKFVDSRKLSEVLLQPFDLYKPGYADSFVLGLINQVAQSVDSALTTELTNRLFQEPGEEFGFDLAALNMQRGRDHGIPAYTRWREWCGLSSVRTWDDLQGIMTNNTINAYKLLFDSPEDIDLWSAGVSEQRLPDALIGPTFACIIGKQFENLRKGDRFWYENGGWPSSFTSDQLQEIRGVVLSRIICDNTDDIETIQGKSMVLWNNVDNKRVSCSSSQLSSIDLTKWKELPPSYENEPEVQRPECNSANHRILNGPRSINDGQYSNGKVHCDTLTQKPYWDQKTISSPDWSGEGWYRFVEPAGTVMPENPPGKWHCSTSASGWINGTHPSQPGESKEISICFAYDQSCYSSTSNTRVTNCGSFYVYYLVDTPSCRLAYCATDSL